MAPTRTRGAGSAIASTSTVEAIAGSKPKRTQHHRKHKETDYSPAGLPGVQKIKSALRQTRRLLAKDKLAADVRTKTERRLKALEAELVQAERANKERALAQRYHAVKFFERRKVTRRIQQVKRQLEKGENSEGQKVHNKERKQLQKKLEELRVDLNYIIHYPKLKKYVSLFPPQLRAGSQAHPDPYPHSHSRPANQADESKAETETDEQREAVRAWVREQMAAGDMSVEPEVELYSREHKNEYPTASHDRQSGTKTSPRTAHPKPFPEGTDGDQFFGDDDVSEEGVVGEVDTGAEDEDEEMGSDR